MRTSRSGMTTISDKKYTDGILDLKATATTFGTLVCQHVVEDLVSKKTSKRWARIALAADKGVNVMIFNF